MVNGANDSLDGVFTQKDKVQILLHEYDTLRTEVIHRINNVYQLLAFVVALIGVLGALVSNLYMGASSSAKVGPRGLIFIAFVSLPVIWLCANLISQDLNRIASRLRELENEINERAGEQLLKWETCQSQWQRYSTYMRMILRPWLVCENACSWFSH